MSYDPEDDISLSRALDRLSDRKYELEAAIRLVLVCWDGMSEDLKLDPAMADAITELRELVAKTGRRQR